jgi:integrase/recombinase XerD
MLDELLPEIGNVRTLKQALAFYATVGMPARNLAQRTRISYHNDLSDLLRFLEKGKVVALDQVQLSYLVAYQAEMDRRGYTPSSRNRKTYAIKTFFQFLLKQGVIENDPSEQLIPPEVARSEPRVLTEAEYKALQQMVRANVRDAAIIELYLQTGMTLAELVRLTLSDIELPKRISPEVDDVGVVRVHRRRGRVAVIPLNYKVCEALDAYLVTRPPVPTDRLFLSRFLTPYSPRAIQYTVTKYLECIGIHSASVRTLRHTMATHHIARGTPLSAVQETLGHTSSDTTAVYIPLAERIRQRALQDHAL